MYRPRGRLRSNFAIWLLLLEVMQIGLDHIPPVTLVALASQVAIYLDIFKLFGLADQLSLDEACVSAYHVWYRNDWRRLLLASVFHANDWHLYYNMVSFLSKAITLERYFGSAGFLCLLGVFGVLVNIVTVGLALLAETTLGDSSYVLQCAVGFSGVLFALKVVTTHLTPPGYQYMMFVPMPIPTQYACWVELLVIQLLLPNVSFIGHLAGILVGLMFVKGPMQFLSSGYSGPSYTYHAGPVGSDSFDDYYQARSFTSARYDGDQPRSSERRDYNRYTGGLSEDEQLQQALRESRASQHSPRPIEPTAPPVEPAPTSRLYPDLQADVSNDTQAPPGQGALNREDLRRRRLLRFSRQT